MNLVAGSRKTTSLRRNAPPHLELPVGPQIEHPNDNFENDSQITPRATNGHLYSATTPGLSIGIATPHANLPNHSPHALNQLPSTVEERTILEKQQSHQSQPRNSYDKSADYFSNVSSRLSSSEDHTKIPMMVGDTAPDVAPHSPLDTDKEEKPKEGTTLFGKKFRMNFPKKLGRSSVEAKPVAVDQISESSDKSEGKEDKSIQDNFFGTVQRIRYEYDQQVQSNSVQEPSTGLNPSPLAEAPFLNPPSSTTIIIQEDRPDSGGVADLYRGTVHSVGQDADLIEQVGPMWLSELLLRV